MLRLIDGLAGDKARGHTGLIRFKKGGEGLKRPFACGVVAL